MNVFDRIAEAMIENNDSVDNIIHTTHSVDQLKIISEIDPFTIWTKQKVYFPSTSENFYNIESVPRNPSDQECGVFY